MDHLDRMDERDGPTRSEYIDHHVGQRIRARRIMLGLSQQQLAQAIGVTYQQAHKYERGLNRISAGRLFEVAVALAVPISYFFEELDESTDISPRHRMTLELARNFSAIGNDRHKEALSHLARVLATGPEGDAS